MNEKRYQCSWCKNYINGHPRCFDYKMYTGSYRGYQPFSHYYFCSKCFSKIAKFMIDNKIHGDKVVKIKSER